MFWKNKNLIYFIAFLSGAAGLIYEIVWIRSLVLVFGSSTHTVTAVISAFLGGLALGSLLIGNWCDKKDPVKLLRIYSFIEFGIGLSALLSLVFLSMNNQIYGYFSDGSTYSLSLLIIKFLLTTLVLLIPTTLMGGTLPILVSILRNRNKNIDINLSLLYSINTFGAVIGIIIAAFVSIELFGLRNTLFLGVLLNVIAGSLMLFMKKESVMQNAKKQVKLPAEVKFNLSGLEIAVLVCFMFSGLLAIAYEILWTRVLTPVTGTFVYAFSFILLLYLLGIAGGSFFYKVLSSFIKNRNLIFSISQVGIGIFALLSAFIVSSYTEKNIFIVLGVILPASIFMGLSFPAANALFKQYREAGKLIGISYFSNTLGSIAGGIIASFVLIPLVGSVQSIVLLAICNFILALILVFVTGNKFTYAPRVVTATCIALIIVSCGLLVQNNDYFYDSATKHMRELAKTHNANFYHFEDDIASVVGFRNPTSETNVLYVDGVEITGKVIETRLMAHLPIAIHPNPQSLLVICFGMGSTFRSSMLHGIETDAVELSPSVAKMFAVYYDDAPQILQNPKGKIIINDGRNYINLTKKRYDIVTIDPPPPVNAAGTTVLYSEDFYRSIQKRLNPKGIVSQWIFYGSRPDDLSMIIKSYANVFPYIVAISTSGYVSGIYLIGSDTPIALNDERINKVFSSQIVREDLKQFNQQFDATEIKALIVGDRNSLLESTKNVPSVTDDHPRTEYFLLRHSNFSLF